MKTQKNAYLVMGYACNEKCRCCPLTYNNDRKKYVGIDELIETGTLLLSQGITDVTISGGEPTLHPDFFNLIEFFIDNSIAVHILSNGERFSDKDYSDRLLDLSTKGFVTVTTTFHSYDPLQHEFQNGSKGSFERSLRGLQYLDANNLCVSIKHCITSSNYHQLPNYLRFVMESFTPSAELQFWGIDLCGLDATAAKNSFVRFELVRPYIEKALNVFEDSGRAGLQTLKLNNIPLCTCDCYYWVYFSSPEDDIYIDQNNCGKVLKPNSSPISTNCVKCPFRSQCMGTYLSAFEMLGNDIVSIPQTESKLLSFKKRIMCLDDNTVGKLFLSPYTEIVLTKEGLSFNNRLSGGNIIIRLHADQIVDFHALLTRGASAKELEQFLEDCGMDGLFMLNDLSRKGLIE